jgi:hypothetical protein
MIVQFSGHATIFSALEPGACFAAELGGRTQIGVKSRDDSGGRTVDSCAVIAANSGEAPRLLPERPLAEWPVLALPEAIFQPSADPAYVQTETAATPEAGMLLLVADRWLITVIAADGTALVDIKSGSIFRGVKDPVRVAFRAWRIVQKGLGDEYDTICRYAVKGQSKVGFARS